MSSIMDMVASACCARSSARISSISSSTWFDARSLRKAETHQGYKRFLFPHQQVKCQYCSFQKGAQSVLLAMGWMAEGSEFESQ
jgi:hypothetical protein